MVIVIDNTQSIKSDKTIIKEIFDWIKTIFLALIIALVVTKLVIINAIIPSDSMENTIMIGDRVVANRLAYTFSDVKRGDVVIFPYPDDEQVLYVKRVIGLPGEKLDIINGDVFINDEPLEEEYVSSFITDYTRNSSYVIPEGHLFMMGDNRSVSKDSRYWYNTFLEIDKIEGKALFRYYPFPKIIK